MRRAIWALVIAIPLVTLLAAGFRHDPNAVASPLLDKRAPSFTLHSLDGRVLSLAALRGHPVVLNFWASWCVSCKDEHQYLIEAWHRYAARGVDFVGITFNDAPSDARDFMRLHGGSWPSVSDPGQKTAVDYGVAQVPETFVIDRFGVVRLRSAGPITPAGPVTPAVLNRELTRLVRGQA